MLRHKFSPKALGKLYIPSTNFLDLSGTLDQIGTSWSGANAFLVLVRSIAKHLALPHCAYMYGPGISAQVFIWTSG